jgi:LmbE family N-acetylglucosaminyl deacetylase
VVLAVHGHPDDEVARCGGTLARYAADGVRVSIVTCTRGEAGQIVDRGLNTPENLARLGEIRMDELERALAILGVTEFRWLGYRDSGMAGTQANDDPRAFARCDLDEAVGRLVRIVREVRPQVILTHNEGGGDGHPDHIRAALVARIAFDRAGDLSAFPEQLEGPGALAAWAPLKLYEAMDQLDRREKLRRLYREQGMLRTARLVAGVLVRWRPARERERAQAAATQGPHTTRIDVRPWLAARHQALLEYRTQIAPAGDLVAIAPEDRALIAPTEDFGRRECRVAAPDEEDDLFAGLREIVRFAKPGGSAA